VPTNLFKKDYQQLSAMLAHFKGRHAFPPLPHRKIFDDGEWVKLGRHRETKSKQNT